ncbi:MAG TPA: alpha/beta fold hydrolase [Alphaproteobacteria bacterium]|nr:alpha/beta fold hydrolase [Alphaproteobacteria bacterium]
MAKNGKIPLILLPCLAGDRVLWEAQIAALGDVADVVVADLTRSDSMAGMARDVLDAAPAKFAMAGLSMGGYASFEIMRQAGERVSKLALLDTSARPDTPEQTVARRDLISLCERGEFKGVTPRVLPRWIHQSRLNDQALVTVVTEMIRRVGKEAFVRQQTAIMRRPDSRPGLSRVRCPTLVLCGRQDQSTPLEHSLEQAADIPNSRLVVIEECGHLSSMERPDEVARAMRAWLTED